MKKIVLTVAAFALFSLTALAQRPMRHYHSTYCNRDYSVTNGVRDTSIRGIAGTKESIGQEPERQCIGFDVL